MKKLIINIIIFITFIIIYILHSNLFTWFKIAGVMPNLFIIFVLFIGLYGHKFMGVTYGIVLGLLLDLFIGKKIGITAIMLGAIGIIGMIFDKNFSKDNRMTIIVMVAISTIVFEVCSYILNYFINEIELQIMLFIKILSVEVIYNCMLTIVVYPFIQLFGNKIEDEYKGNKILTRYF